MEPTTQPTDQTPIVSAATPSAQPAQLHAIVDYMPNISIFGSKSVLLEWTADNRIRLYEMDFDTNKATNILFDVAPSEIKKVTGSVNMLTFHIGDKIYRTLFARMETAGIGPLGMGVALGQLKASGVSLWVKKLKENGVKIEQFGWGKTFIVAIIIVIAVSAVVITFKVQNGSL